MRRSVVCLVLLCAACDVPAEDDLANDEAWIEPPPSPSSSPSPSPSPSPSSSPSPSPSPSPRTRIDVTARCDISATLLMRYLHCSCHEIEKPCSDTACGFCDGTLETREYCDGYTYPVGVLYPIWAACSDEQTLDCQDFCDDACTSGCLAPL